MSSEITQSKANDTESWQCTMCGLLNKSTRISCQACFFKPMTYKIGDKISVKYDNQFKYRAATILEINNTKIKISLDNPYRDWHTTKWIDYTDSSCSIYDRDSYFSYTKLPLFAPESDISDIVCYNNKLYASIFEGSFQSHRPGIHLYDIKKNSDTFQSNPAIAYPKLNFKFEEHAMAIDKYRNEMYLISPKMLFIYNTITNKWQSKRPVNAVNMRRFISCIYIEYPIDEIYILGIGNEHLSMMKYSKTHNSFVDILPAKIKRYNLERSAMIYDSKRQRIMLLGGHPERGRNNHSGRGPGHVDNIWVYSVGTADAKWELMSVKLPYKSHHKGVFYALDSIVFVVYYGAFNPITDGEGYTTIWCLDLMTNKWFTSMLTTPRELHANDCVVTPDNYVHFIHTDICGPIHFKVDIKQIIPQKLLEFYREYFLKLVNGFLRSEIEELYTYNVGNDIKLLISKYCNHLSKF